MRSVALGNATPELFLPAAGRHFAAVTGQDYVLPRLRTKFAERGFSYAGPVAWNRLPESIRRTSSQAAFCDAFNIVV